MNINQNTKWQNIVLAVWLLPALAIAILTLVQPLNRSMTPIYHDAFANWLAQKPVYSGSQGFNYLPAFVSFFGLFARLPLVLCEVLWRWTALAGLCLGLWKCTRLLKPSNTYRAFGIISLLSLPICLSALRNGQSSAQLAACLVLTAWSLQRQRWWWASLWLCLALVCKPLGLPAIGLAVVMFPRVLWRTALGVILVLAEPYLLAPSGYVNELYVSFATNMIDCFEPAGRTFADLNGVLMAFNLRLSGSASLIVRVFAGGAMAVTCFFTRKLGTDIKRPLIWLALTGSYIMLFTPMNEGNSYVMLAPCLGLWAWWFFENGRERAAKSIGLMSTTMVMLPDIVGFSFGKQYGNEFAKFLYPLLTLIFLGMVIWEIRRSLADALDNNSQTRAPGSINR